MYKQSESQLIGREGENWFVSQLPSSWVAQRPTEDVGVDFLVVICEDSKLNGLEFRVQVKSARELRAVGADKRISLNKNSLINLCSSYTPALIVCYETKSKTGYCQWLNKTLANNISDLKSNKVTVTVTFPASNKIIPEVWPLIGEELHGVNRNIFGRLHKASWSFPVLKFTRTLNGCLRTFDSVTHHWSNSVVETNKQISALHALELSAYVELIFAVYDLQEELPKNELTQLEGLQEFVEETVCYCQEFAAEFSTLVKDRDADMSVEAIAMVVDHNEIVSKRAGAIRSIIDLQHQVVDIAMDIQIQNFSDTGA